MICEGQEHPSMVEERNTVIVLSRKLRCREKSMNAAAQFFSKCSPQRNPFPYISFHTLISKFKVKNFIISKGLFKLLEAVGRDVKRYNLTFSEPEQTTTADHEERLLDQAIDFTQYTTRHALTT